MSASATQVGRVFLGTHVPPLDELLLLDFPHSITNKLLVVSASLDPVKSYAAIKPTMDTFNWETLQCFFNVIHKIRCHVPGH